MEREAMLVRLLGDVKIDLAQQMKVGFLKWEKRTY